MNKSKKNSIVVGAALLLLLVSCESSELTPTAPETDNVSIEMSASRSHVHRLRDSIDVLNAQIAILEWNLCIEKQMRGSDNFRISCLRTFITDNGLEDPVCPGRSLNPGACE